MIGGILVMLGFFLFAVSAPIKKKKRSTWNGKLFLLALLCFIIGGILASIGL